MYISVCRLDKCNSDYSKHVWEVGWWCLTSHRQRGHLETVPHLLSLANDVKLDKYTVLTGNRTPGHRMAVYYITTALRQLLSGKKDKYVIIIPEQHYNTIKSKNARQHKGCSRTYESNHFFYLA